MAIEVRRLNYTKRVALTHRVGHPFVLAMKAIGGKSYAFLVVTTAGVVAFTVFLTFLTFFGVILVVLALVAANAGVDMIPPNMRASSEAAKMRREECFVCMAISFR